MTCWYEIILGVAKVTREERPKSREIFWCATPHCSLICHRILVHIEALQHIICGIVRSQTHYSHAKRGGLPSFGSCHFPKYRLML
jgi:hypothetical protein